MNLKAAQKERTHQEILASAAKLLRGKGVSGARVLDVMKGAGLTVGGFYAHFASKEALIDETLRRTASELRAQLFAGLAEKPESDRAEVVLKRYLSARHRDNPDTGCPFPSITGEIATQHEAHRDVLAEQFNALACELEPLLPGRASSARALAVGLAALMVGGLSMARALGKSDLSEEVLRACRAFGRLALSTASSASERKP
jgi:TetR/AcrR family transcriptional regulator, transcriptional repressor for nem operon